MNDEREASEHSDAGLRAGCSSGCVDQFKSAAPKVLCAYNVNIDSVHTLVGDDLLRLFGSLQALAADIEGGEGGTEAFRLMEALTEAVVKGRGDEMLIHRHEVAHAIRNALTWVRRMGGNAGNMANVLAALGAAPVVNVPSLTSVQASLFHPSVKVPVSSDRQTILIHPGAVARPGQDLEHFVLQFRGGTTISTPDGSVVPPRENRFIASYDPMNGRLFTDPAFARWSASREHEIDGVLLSGFHLVPFRGYREIYEERIDQINRWSSRGIIGHAEMGRFERPEMMQHLLEMIEVRSIGMNEEELSMIEPSQQGWRSIVEGAQALRDRISVQRICVHTREFTISVSEPLIPPELEIDALTYGADVAGALVATGRIVKTPEPILGWSSGLEVSGPGLDAARAFVRDGGTRSGRGVYNVQDGEAICLVPSVLARRPLINVGIGDTMTAAVFYREILAARSG